MKFKKQLTRLEDLKEIGILEKTVREIEDYKYDTEKILDKTEVVKEDYKRRIEEKFLR